MIVVILAVLGLSAGSFVNALAWRLHQQSKKRSKSSKSLSIMNGRSMCPRCKHQLAAKDLVPVLSWLALNGRCRYCKKPISWQYPIVELAMAAVFVVSYLFWPGNLADNGQVLLLATWLVSSVGLLALLVYDLKWMLLPTSVLYSTFAMAAVGRLGYILFFADDKRHSFWLLVLSLAVSSGIFWVLCVVSKERWIGFGDVSLGFTTGTLLADPQLAFLMIFSASLLGTIYVLPSLLTGQQKLTGRLPYGPFLIVASGFCLLWGDSVIHWYRHLFLG